MSLLQGARRGRSLIATALIAAAMMPTATHADERPVTAKTTLVACENPRLIDDFFTLLRAQDEAAARSHIDTMLADPGCAMIGQGQSVYVDQMAAIGTAFQMALGIGLREIVPGLNTEANIVRVRIAGETTWRYTLMEFLL